MPELHNCWEYDVAALIDARIKLRHLNALLETVRLGGVARAADVLGMTQPAVSKAIAELEDILGVGLFDRSRRALALTHAGQIFLRHAEAAMASLRQGVETLEEGRNGVRFVAFGALPSVAAGVVPRALKRFSTSSFACRTLVESGPSPYLLGLLRRASIDFVVGRLAHPDAMEGLAFEQLYAEELAFIVRPGHPLAGAERLSLAQLDGYQLLLPPRQAIISPAIDALLIANRLSRGASSIETVSNSLGRSYVLLSDAVWIISRGVVERDVEAGQLVQLPFDLTGTRGPVGITTRGGAELSLPAQALLDCIRLSVG